MCSVAISSLKMEVLFLRFPTLRDMILNKLDYKNLMNCKKISRIIYKLLEEGKLLQIRICQKDIYECPNIWETDLTKPTADIFKDLAENHLKVSLNKTIVEKWPRFWDLVFNENDVKIIRELKKAIQQKVSIITYLDFSVTMVLDNFLALFYLSCALFI